MMLSRSKSALSLFSSLASMVDNLLIIIFTGARPCFFSMPITLRWRRPSKWRGKFYMLEQEEMESYVSIDLLEHSLTLWSLTLLLSLWFRLVDFWKLKRLGNTLLRITFLSWVWLGFKTSLSLLLELGAFLDFMIASVWFTKASDSELSESSTAYSENLRTFSD